MKKVLIIGATVTDVIIRLDHLPHTEEDMNTHNQQFSLGGCSYNVSDMLRHFKIPYSLFSPVGGGIYGDFVTNELKKKKVLSACPKAQENNGCCYCLVEADGKRTFISVRGAEYHFKKEWLSLLDPSAYDYVYLCGLDLEEKGNDVILDFLDQHAALKVIFAPGPRLCLISAELMHRIFSHQPLLHLNKEEALSYTNAQTILQAATTLFAQTHNSVVITDAANGASIFDGQNLTLVPACPAHQIDTIGAGDAHIGVIIACLKKGYSLSHAVLTANYISAAVVQHHGSLLSDEAFYSLDLSHLVPDLP